MSHAVLQALAIFAVGIAAGTINTVVGSGTLITFPTLLGFGYPPVLANVSNNVGLVPGTLSGIQGYRRELAGQRARIIRLGSASLLGGLVGAILLLVLPQSAFKAIVPVLIGLALVMVVLQPWLARQVAARQGGATGGGATGDNAVGNNATGDSATGDNATGGGSTGNNATGNSATGGGSTEDNATGDNAGQDALQLGGPVLWVLVFALGVYGGYFGAAQGILLLGLLGITWSDDLQRINAVKNVLACIVNGVAAIVFIIATHIDWGAAGLIAAGSVIGGQIGARVGRRLPPWGLRALIICVGVAALGRLLA